VVWNAIKEVYAQTAGIVPNNFSLLPLQLGGACVRGDCQDALSRYYREMGAPITADRKTIDKIIASLRLASKVDVHVVTPEEATGYMKAGTIVYIMTSSDECVSRMSSAEAVQICHNREKQRADEARLANQLMARDKYKSKARSASVDRPGAASLQSSAAGPPPPPLSSSSASSLSAPSAAGRGPQAASAAAGTLGASTGTGGSTAFEVYQKAMAEFGNGDFGQFGLQSGGAVGASQPPFGLHGTRHPERKHATVDA
jgi:hypothetical protein